MEFMQLRLFLSLAVLISSGMLYAEIHLQKSIGYYRGFPCKSIYVNTDKCSLDPFSKTSKEKFSEKSSSLKERINIVKSNSFTDRTKNNLKAKFSERSSSIAERINLVKSNSFTDQTKNAIRTKLSERSESFKERVKLERFGSSRTRI